MKFSYILKQSEHTELRVFADSNPEVSLTAWGCIYFFYLMKNGNLMAVSRQLLLKDKN